MLHQGYFRSTDTSVDEKGQLFKVEIFTDGKMYTYRLNGVPLMEEITLSDNPFEVSYSTDNNKYKSYKGSTASVGIILDSYDFITKGKCDIFVRLLKWKNEVVVEGDTMTNTETGATLNKRHIYSWFNFVPAEEDYFAWEVEWVGFATPNVYSQNFTRVTEEYVLECQDVLTTLQYYDYESSQNGVTSFIDSVKESLNKLPIQCINNLYCTNTKVMPITHSANGTTVWLDGRQVTLLENLKTINDNWINESYERNNCLQVIDNIMAYLGLTIIQWKDDFYCTTPDAIAQGRKFYYKYDLTPPVFTPGTGVTIQSITLTPTERLKVLVGKDIEISDGELSTDSTKISTTDTYKKAIITTDEFYDSNLVVDIDNDDRLDERFRWDDTVVYLKLDDVDRNIFSNIYPYNYNMENATAHWAGSVYDVAENDVNDTNYASIDQYYYNRDTADQSGHYSVQSFTTVAAPIDHQDMFYKVGCSIVDFSANDISDNNMSQFMTNYSGQRAYLFHNTYEQVGAGAAYELGVVPLMLDPNKLIDASYAQTVIGFKTKKVMLKSGQAINITGNLEFFQTVQLPMAAGWTVEQLKAYRNYMFVWCRMKVFSNRYNRYLYVTNQPTSSTGYTWTTTDTWFKFWYDNYATLDPEADRNDQGTTTMFAFENLFSFTKNTRGVDGTCFYIPVAFNEGEYQQIEFEMKRPWGCGREDLITSTEHFYPAQYTVMTNFKINVVDRAETQFRYTAEENNQFNVKVNDLGVDDFEHSLLVSSDYYKNTSKATVYGLTSDMLVIDQATGSGLFPEANYILNIEKSYATSKLLLDINLPYEVSPFDKITWMSQMDDKVFSVNHMSIDYAYNRYSLQLIEDTLDEVSADIFSEKRTKNFRRNGDNLYNPLPSRNKKNVVNPTEGDATIQFYFLTDVYGGTNTRDTDSLVKTIYFEPYNTIEVIATCPDYLEDNISFEIDTDGNFIINYNI